MFAGAYGSYGRNEGTVDDFDLSVAGHADFNAYTVGLYGTYYGAGAWYVDAVVQATRYDVWAGSGLVADMKAVGAGVAASLEVGVPLPIGGGFSIKPQGQIIHQNIDLGDAFDAAAAVRFDKASSFAGRVGVRLLHEGTASARPISAWVRANVWREFSANPMTSFSAADGYVTFRANMREAWADFGLGISARLGPNAHFYVGASYQMSLGRGLEAGSGRAGLRLNW